MVLKTEVLSEKIDWIAYTQKTSTDWAFPGYIDNHWKKISPLRNYTHGEENKQGVKRFWNIITASQGHQVMLDGSASSILGENQETFLSWLGSLDARPTRLDFSVDITHTDFNPKGCISHLRNGKVKTHAQSAMQVTDEFKGGFTQYVGTKSSETYTRIYDKAVEQKTDYTWVRIETVYQGDRAEASLQAYLQHRSTRPLIRAHVDFPAWKAWARVMAGEVCKVRVKPKISNTRQWLLDSVAGTIAKEMVLDEDEGFLNTMLDRIALEYAKLSKSDTINW